MKGDEAGLLFGGCGDGTHAHTQEENAAHSRVQHSSMYAPGVHTRALPSSPRGGACVCVGLSLCTCCSRSPRRPLLLLPFDGRLGLLVLGEYGVDVLEGLVDLLPQLGARQHDLARYEDQQHNLGLHHTVDETREQLGLVLHEGRVSDVCKEEDPVEARTLQ